MSSSLLVFAQLIIHYPGDHVGLFSTPAMTGAFAGDRGREREKEIDKPVRNRYNLRVDVLPRWRKDVPLNFGGRPRKDLIDKEMVIYPRSIAFQKDVTALA